MTKHASAVNTESLLLLTWLSTLDLQAQIREDQEAHPGNSSYRQLPAFPQERVRAQIDLALTCFQRDPIYGPLLAALVRDRLTYVDFLPVVWAIEVEEQTEPASALFFSNKPSCSERQQASECIDEADVFSRVLSQHRPLADRLHRLSKAWNGDVCRGALELQSFFGWYLDLAARALRMPFFLTELLRRSFHRVDWHVVAASVASRPSHEECRCANRRQEDLLGAIAEYLGEVFKVTGDETVSLGQQLPEPERTQALLLADLCRETTKAMRLYVMNGEAR